MTVILNMMPCFVGTLDKNKTIWLQWNFVNFHYEFVTLHDGYKSLTVYNYQQPCHIRVELWGIFLLNYSHLSILRGECDHSGQKWRTLWIPFPGNTVPLTHMYPLYFPYNISNINFSLKDRFEDLRICSITFQLRQWIQVP